MGFDHRQSVSVLDAETDIFRHRPMPIVRVGGNEWSGDLPCSLSCNGKRALTTKEESSVADQLGDLSERYRPNVARSPAPNTTTTTETRLTRA